MTINDESFIGDGEIQPEDILQYQNYILEELNNLEKNFNEIFSDIVFLREITSQSLRNNPEFLKLDELYSTITKEKKKIEELKKLENFWKDRVNQDQSSISYSEEDDLIKEFLDGLLNTDHPLKNPIAFSHIDYLHLLNESVREYQINLDQYKINFRELTEKIKIAEKSIREIEELKNTARRVNELSLKKIEIVPTNSLITNDKNDEDLEESYFYKFFLKIEESREKLKILQNELEDFCQQQSYLNLVNLNDHDEDKIKKKTN